MEKWILSANSNYFNHAEAFHTLGYVDWKQTRNYSVGDIIYVYVTKPVSKIQFKTEVIMIDMTEDEICDLDEYWIKGKPDNSRKTRYARLRLIDEYEDERFSFDALRKHGLQYAPQSPCKVKDELQEFIDDTEEKQNG